MESLADLLSGPFVDTQMTYAFKRAVAYGMMCLFASALVFQSLLRRPGLVRTFDPSLWSAMGTRKFMQTFRLRFTWLLVAVAVVASLSYFMRSAPSRSYLHKWDAYHTVLGAKYHDELGYFDLYKCTLAVGRARGSFFDAVREVRDLRTRKFVPIEQHLQGNDCAARFTPERLAAFERDIELFGPALHQRDWARLFKDKGFNGTPFYTVVVTALLNVTGGTLQQLTHLSLLDPLLMLGAFAAVGWAFGLRTAALYAIFFCCFFPNRYVHMGGSILRFDYIAALTGAVCAVKKDRWGLAGALLAWSTMVRVFPVLFAGALVLKCASEIWEGRRFEPHHERFILSFGTVLLVLLTVSFVGLDGAKEDWTAWWENMRVHNHKSASFRIGFKHLFMLEGSMERVNYGRMQALFESRQIAYYTCVVLLLSPLLLAVRHLSASSFMALFGSVAFFLLVVSTRYYYSVIALLFLVDRDMFKNRTLLIMGALLFGSSAFDFFYFGTHQNHALMYNFILGAQLALVVGALSVGLLFDPALADGVTLPVDRVVRRSEPREQTLLSGESSERSAQSGAQSLPSIARRT